MEVSNNITIKIPGSPNMMDVIESCQIVLTKEFILNNKLLNIPYVITKINRDEFNKPTSVNISSGNSKIESKLEKIDWNYPNMIDVVIKKLDAYEDNY